MPQLYPPIFAGDLHEIGVRMVSAGVRL